MSIERLPPRQQEYLRNLVSKGQLSGQESRTTALALVRKGYARYTTAGDVRPMPAGMMWVARADRQKPKPAPTQDERRAIRARCDAVSHRLEKLQLGSAPMYDYDKARIELSLAAVERLLDRAEGSAS